MFSYLYEWMMKLSFYMVMVTMVMHVVPNSDYKRYIRFFTGLALAVMLTDPFLRLLGMGNLWQRLYDSPVYREQVEKMEEASQYLYGASEDLEAGLLDIWQENEDDSASMGVDEIKIGR